MDPRDEAPKHLVFMLAALLSLGIIGSATFHASCSKAILKYFT